MKISRRIWTWMILVALASLVSGMAVGVVLPGAYAAMVGEEEGDEWLARFKQQYDLDGEQVRLIRIVLAVRSQERERVIAANHSTLPASLRALIEQVHRRADDRIEAVLDEEQLARYRKDKQLGSKDGGQGR